MGVTKLFILHHTHQHWGVGFWQEKLGGWNWKFTTLPRSPEQRDCAQSTLVTSVPLLPATSPSHLLWAETVVLKGQL